MGTTLHKPKPKSKKRKKAKPLPTIWEVSDDLWRRVLPILQEFWPGKRTGRHHADWRRALDGIIFRMRSGCQWEKLPRRFGPKSTVHDWFQRWCSGGVMKRIWAELVKDCADLGGVNWEWQSADCSMGKARFGGKKGREKPHGSRQKGHQEEYRG
jgi:putative transposase